LREKGIPMLIKFSSHVFLGDVACGTL
jgi:hypothetical protein